MKAPRSSMPWIEMRLRDQKVLARCDAGGEPIVEGGRVEIRYRPRDGRAYRAGARNLKPVDGASVLPDDHCGPAEPSAPAAQAGATRGPRKAKPRRTPDAPPAHEEDAVIVYADGACSGNPGPAGVGVVVVDGAGRAELSEFLGRGTNNVAELTAILRAAERLADRRDKVRIYTDSRYSIGVLTQGWKAKKNTELVQRVKDALGRLPDVKLHYVPGPAGVPLNEAADALARTAVSERRTASWVEERSSTS
ncbi:MAG: ribonuclease HI [Sandaracinaceae bacterium]